MENGLRIKKKYKNKKAYFPFRLFFFIVLDFSVILSFTESHKIEGIIKIFCPILCFTVKNAETQGACDLPTVSELVLS